MKPHEVVEVELPALVLRDFDWRLRPQYNSDGSLRAVALDLVSKVGLPLQLTAMFDRGEFVSLATGGLGMMDAEDERQAAPARPSLGVMIRPGVYVKRHAFEGRHDRDCLRCELPDRHEVHHNTDGSRIPPPHPPRDSHDYEGPATA